MADFDQFAQTYSQLLDQSVALSGETSHYFADYKARYMAAALQPNGSRQKILDFGCGVGLLSTALKDYLPDVILHGYDLSPASIDRIDPALALAGRFTADITRLDNDYEAIVLAAVLHHVPVNQRTTLMRDLADRLSASGKLFVFEHNPLNPATRWAVNQCPFDRDAVLLKPGEVVGRLRAAGLRFVRRDYIVFFPKPFSYFRPIERFLGWCPLGAQYVIIAAKDPPTRIGELRNTDSGARR